RVRAGVGLVGVVESRPRLWCPEAGDDDIRDPDPLSVVEPRAEVRVYRRVEPDRSDQRRRVLRDRQPVGPLIPYARGREDLAPTDLWWRAAGRNGRGRGQEERKHHDPRGAHGRQMSLCRIAIATAWVRLTAPRRSDALRTWVRTVSAPIPSRWPISSSCIPCASSDKTSRSRSVRWSPSTSVFAMP